jgi:hypothetical protein
MTVTSEIVSLAVRSGSSDECQGRRATNSLNVCFNTIITDRLNTIRAATLDLRGDPLHPRVGVAGERIVKRPRKRAERFPNKTKVLVKSVSADMLEAAELGAKYKPSDYHCRIDGRPPRRRAKPAMHCPRDFSIREAVNAIKAAIRARRVSRQWVNGFPRHLWHKEGDVWYEASTNDGTAGTYHAYPIEITGLPAGLQR